MTTEARARTVTLARSLAATLGAGATFTAGPFDVQGHRRVKGFLHSPTDAAAGPAAGDRPVVEMSADGVDWSMLSFPIDLDPNVDFTYIIDLPIVARFLRARFTAGAGAGTPFTAFIYVEP